ncbi:MAG: hypothetical protein WDM90_21750 [Ferruginibacter sp.]
MRKKKCITLAVLLFSACFAFSQNDDSVMIKKISDQILLHGKAYSSLYTLCKSVGQRLSGSAGMYKGEAWACKL